jgi:tripartite-type tricarboxylate transporter receptor subunit TctC
MWLALPLSSSLAQRDYFPSRPITIVIPFTPGGSADVLMRLVGQKLSESVKQPVLLDNRAGGGGNVGRSLSSWRRPTDTRCSWPIPAPTP